MATFASGTAEIWLARGAIVVVIGLQVLMVENFALGSRWFAPAVEIALLVPVIWLSIRNARLENQLEFGDDEIMQEHEAVRQKLLILALSLIAVVSVANGVALFALVSALTHGGGRQGATLLYDAANIWATNVIVFGLWYWGIDRGGPARYPLEEPPPSDFIFPQMTLPANHPDAGRPPRFADYLFLSFTTSTAFSPTDTLPLTTRMKALMALEAGISLVTIALVTARAVNILR